MATCPGRRLLIVDDEEPILFAMHAYFTSIGYEVHTAPTAEDAIARVEGGPYLAAFVDLRLGWSDDDGGLKVIEALHARQPETGILLLTAYGSPRLEEEARRLGANRLLHKPQPLPALARILGELEARSPSTPRSAAGAPVSLVSGRD